MNTESITPFNTFAMDDPSTPLYNPDGSSYELDLPLQNQNYAEMQSQTSTQICNTTGNQDTSLPIQDELFGTFLQDLLKNNSYMNEMIEDFISDWPMDTENIDIQPCAGPQCDNVPSNSPSELSLQVYPTLDDEVNGQNGWLEESYLDTRVEKEILNVSETFPSLEYQLDFQQIPPTENVSTPEIVRMFSESQNSTQEVQIVNLVVIPGTSSQSVQVRPVTETISREVLTEDSSSVPVKPTKNVGKRRAFNRKDSVSSSDQRRIKNNEASKKSRKNRKEKQLTQAQLTIILEKETEVLESQVKQLEELKTSIIGVLKPIIPNIEEISGMPDGPQKLLSLLGAAEKIRSTSQVFFQDASLANFQSATVPQLQS